MFARMQIHRIRSTSEIVKNAYRQNCYVLQYFILIVIINATIFEVTSAVLLKMYIKRTYRNSLF